MSRADDVLADLDHEISVLAGPMSTAEQRKRWPGAESEHLRLLRKRQQHVAAKDTASGDDACAT
ncbi:hypothetical protein [Stenotrophomonas sp. CCNWLW4]|uniref:hypothetical protein n=1 Tax=Stenotrophomonas sp. CCNWLW4 TaxID=3126383 RepID=UPI003012D5C7